LEHPDASLRVVPLSRVFAGLAVLCLGAMLLVGLLGRVDVTRNVSLAGLAVGVAAAAVLALIHRRPLDGMRAVASTVVLVFLGVPAAALAWFFGPNSGFEAFVGIAVIVTGVLSGATSARFPTAGGWATYLSLASGQLTVLVLILTGSIPDVSLTRVVIEGHPMWHHVAAHLSLQGVFLAAFLIGRAFQRRYAVLATDLERVVRTTSRREALLGEARAEYRQTLELGRSGIFSGRKMGDFRIGKLLGRESGTEIYDAVDDNGAAASVRLEGGTEGVSIARAEASDLTAPDQADGRASSAPAGSLAEVIANHDKLDDEQLWGLVEDITEELGNLHDRGLVHAAITTATVLRKEDEEGQGGWRLAKSPVLDPSAPTTLSYLAPERVRGREAGTAADVYSVAAILYEAVTGVPPYHEVAPSSLAKAVLERLPLAPRRFTDVSPSVETALCIGLSRRVDERYESVDALKMWFLRALRGDPEGTLAKRARGLSDDWEGSTLILDASSGTFAPREDDGGTTSLDDDSLAEKTHSGRPGTTSRDASVTDRMRASILSEPPRPSTAPTDAWREAYRRKMRDQRLAVVLLCGGGSAVLWSLAREPLPFYVAAVCMAAILVIVWLTGWLALRSGGEAPYWPWGIVAALSVGPAYSLGLHSAFVGVVSFILVSGGMFRAGAATSGDRRRLLLAGLVTTYTLVFVGIAAGLLPDEGNVPVFDPVAPRWEAAVLHVLIMSLFVLAYAAGRLVDQRYAALTETALAAGRAAAAQELLLAEARRELDALARLGGIFSGLTVGRFEIGELLGRGGMGEVYAANAVGGERVALKLVRGDRVADPRALQMFLGEAEALRRVESPYVARIVEVADLEQELPFIAMEFIEGQSLHVMLRERDRLDLGEARRLARDVARGLADVHAASVLHCDVKPHNVVFTEAVGWKLVDFGVARRPGGHLSTTSRAGTPGYMAPEQGLGEGVDVRSDLYSLCLVLYRALTGRPAYTGSDPTEVAHTARYRGPPDPERWVALPDDVRLALRLGLAARADERYQTAGDLAVAFEEAFDGRLAGALRQRARRLPWA